MAVALMAFSGTAAADVAPGSWKGSLKVNQEQIQYDQYGDRRSVWDGSFEITSSEPNGHTAVANPSYDLFGSATGTITAFPKYEGDPTCVADLDPSVGNKGGSSEIALDPRTGAFSFYMSPSAHSRVADPYDVLDPCSGVPHTGYYGESDLPLDGKSGPKAGANSKLRWTGSTTSYTDNQYENSTRITTNIDYDLTFTPDLRARCKVTANSKQRLSKALRINVFGAINGCDATVKSVRYKIGRKVYRGPVPKPRHEVKAQFDWPVRLKIRGSTRKAVRKALKSKKAVRAKVTLYLDHKTEQFDFGHSTKVVNVRIK